MVVLGATDLEAGMKADVAPSSDPVILASSQAKQAHVSKLSKERKTKKLPPKLGKRKKQETLDQNTFEFMEDQNQRGIFDDSSRNLYEGEDLDVPAYLRRGVKIMV